MTGAEVGVIGGSGFYEMAGLGSREEVLPSTPFGSPSDALVVGTLAGVRVAFLARHGRGHRLLPAEVPARANIYALKSLGVRRVIAVSAVGSLREELAPQHAVIPDQLIDRTRGAAASTFFGGGLVAHVAFAEPFCPEVGAVLQRAASAAGVPVHRGGTYVAIEGPQFSTRAESELYRSWGADIIGMTALPEAKLAREAELCYGLLALVTDYDCWHREHESVSVEMILANLRRNVANAQRIVRGVVAALPAERRCACRDALAGALVTSPELVPAQVKRDLAPILGRYIAAEGG